MNKLTTKEEAKKEHQKRVDEAINDMFAAAAKAQSEKEMEAFRMHIKKCKQVREKLGKVETSLNSTVGHNEGVGKFSIREIMYVYGVNRSTAYRWQKDDVHPLLYPKYDSRKNVRWVMPTNTEEAPQKKPWNPRLDIIRQARSAVRCAINKLEKLEKDKRYDRFPFDDDCIEAAEEVEKAASELYWMVDDYDIEDDLTEEEYNQLHGFTRENVLGEKAASEEAKCS